MKQHTHVAPNRPISTLFAAAMILLTAAPAAAIAAPRDCIIQDFGGNAYPDGSGGLAGTSMWLRLQQSDGHADLKALRARMAEKAKAGPGIVHRTAACHLMSGKLSFEEENCQKLSGSPCRNKDDRNEIYGTEADKAICARRVKVVREIGKSFGCPEGEAGKLWIPRQ